MNPSQSIDGNNLRGAAGLYPGSQIIIRWAGPPIPERLTIDNPESISKIWRDFVASCPHFDPSKESFAVIGVNPRLHFIGWHLVGIGTAYNCAVSPAAAFRSLFAMHADGFIAIHNHPSGVVLPSLDDEKLTLGLGGMARALDIRFHDHVIVDSEGLNYFSFRETNLDAFSGWQPPKCAAQLPEAERIERIDLGVVVKVPIPRVFIRKMGGVKGVQNDLFNMISDPKRLSQFERTGKIRAFLRDLKRAESYKLRSSHELILPAKGWATIMDLAKLFKTSRESFLMGLCSRLCRENRTSHRSHSLKGVKP